MLQIQRTHCLEESPSPTQSKDDPDLHFGNKTV